MLTRGSIPAALLPFVLVTLVGVPDGLAAPKEHSRAWYGPHVLKSGLVLPYRMDNLFRGFFECRRDRHPALDIGGVGKDYGLGTPVFAVGAMKITGVGTPESKPSRFGKRLRGGGTTKRGGRMLPRSRVIPGYGKVWFFTRTYGSARSGVLVTGRLTEGRYKGYQVRYMHLGAAHPTVKKGATVEAGAEIGVMGGTAVQKDGPHVHFEIIHRNGRKLDPGPLLGIGPTRLPCRKNQRYFDIRRDYAAKARKVMLRLEQKRAAQPQVAADASTAGCGLFVHEGGFDGGKAKEHRVMLDPAGSRGPWTVRVDVQEGRWEPRVEVRSSTDQVLWTGAWAAPKVRKRYRFDVESSGRKGTFAEVALRPRKSPLQLVVRAWNKRRPPKKARYRLTVDRPCPKDKAVGGRQ